ncbi:unnamed protein product [Fusarium equiseti]|uniref:Thioredoxin n=1 Tax=Fusarium equiseti TaxID=61235 RepID=A0A8J2N6L1_FUSEQ|nr:unnamed protein product [Fusarium equiseti]
MPIIDIKDRAHFKELIQSNKVVIIDAWASWCGPCRMIDPIYERFSEAEQFTKTGVVFAKLDVDSNEAVAGELKIRAMPTVLVFRNGNKVDELTGVNPVNLQELVVKATILVY